MKTVKQIAIVAVFLPWLEIAPFSYQSISGGPI